jgi:Tfp pilus assembly protein FimT
MVLRAAMATAPTSRAGSWPTKPSAGYTFLELTVVITIILMAVAIGVPRLLSWVNEGNLGAECRRLAGTIRYVRNEAARRRTSFFLTLDLENAAYWIDVRRDPSQVEHRGYYVSSTWRPPTSAWRP